MPTTTFELSLAAFAAAVLMIIAAKIAERQLRRFDITQLRNTRFHWNHLPTRLLLLSTTMLLSSVFGYILVIATYVLYGLHLHQLAQAEAPEPDQQYLEDSLLVYSVIGCGIFLYSMFYFAKKAYRALRPRGK